jgi:hypothetical protein
MLCAANATLTVVDATNPTSPQAVRAIDFVSHDMTKKVILSVAIPIDPPSVFS